MLTKIATFLSTFFNPMNSLVIYFILFSIKNLTLVEAAKQFLPILLIIIIPLSGYLYYKVKTGSFTDSDVSDRHQRKSLYFFIAGAITVYLFYVFMQEQKVDWIILFLLILLIVMQVSNYFIKSSMHTALNIYVAALMFTLDPLLGAFWLLVSLAVAVSRVILKRHTWAEVFSGAALATILSFIYLYTQIQQFQ